MVDNIRRLIKADSKKMFVLISLIPILALFLVFSFIPIFLSILVSLFNYNPLSSNPPFIGLKNYTGLFSDPVFVQSLLNTFYFVIVAVITNIILATLVALLISSAIKSSSVNFFRTVFFLPTTANIAAVSVVWVYLLDPSHGGIKVLLDLFGSDTIIYWLGDPKLVLPTIIAVTLWQDIGYNIIIILSGLQSIPRIYFEASRIDGANVVQTFFRIKLPLLIRTMLFVSVMTVISYFQMFTQVSVMTQGNPQHASELIALNIYFNAFRYSRLGYASAEAVVLLVIILVITLIQIKLAKADWEY